MNGFDGVPDSSLDLTTTRKRNPHITEDLVGMETFIDIMINKNLTKEELWSKLAMKFNLLVCISDANLLSIYNAFIQIRYADSIGLDLSVSLLPSSLPGVSSILSPV